MAEVIRKQTHQGLANPLPDTQPLPLNQLSKLPAVVKRETLSEARSSFLPSAVSSLA